MKLSELSGAHVGSRVTITTTFATITGVLRSVTSAGRGVTNMNFGGVQSMYISRTEVSVQVGAFEARDLDSSFDCEVHEK